MSEALSRVTRDIAILAATYPRLFGVCALCPHGSHLPGMGTRATHWIPDSQVGEFGVCGGHPAEVPA